MMTFLRQLWRSEDLRGRILLTIGLLALYRLLAHITVPGVDPQQLELFLQSRDNAAGTLGIFSALTGGSLENFSIVMLGLGPYINASIIVQLCTVIFPKLEALRKEGHSGQQTLSRYTRWLALPLALLQSYGFLILLGQGGVELLDLSFPGVLLPILFVSTGSLFLMWLGEMITEKGISNGSSLIIFAGIVAAMPSQFSSLFLAGDQQTLSAFYLFALVSVALLVVIVLFNDAHRLIPITYANQGAGRGVQGGIPIRLNQAGMIPIIFAISLLAFPSIVAQFLQTSPNFQWVAVWISTHLNPQSPSLLYLATYFGLVVIFTFFYVSVTFQPADVAEQIQKRGGFVPGVRPGPQTAAILQKTSLHLNLWGGIFLGVVAIIPLLFTRYSSLTSAELLISGSGMIIIVGVVMDLIRQINAQMLAHDYEKLV
jgi:preprotein translocase subunit SecY